VWWPDDNIRINSAPLVQIVINVLPARLCPVWPCQIAHKGALIPYVQVFVEQMQAHGYAAASVELATRLVKDFTSWLDQHGIEGHRLSATLVADYLEDRTFGKRRGHDGRHFILSSEVVADVEPVHRRA
jgi:hypothetical protein